MERSQSSTSQWIRSTLFSQRCRTSSSSASWPFFSKMSRAMSRAFLDPHFALEAGAGGGDHPRRQRGVAADLAALLRE